MLKFRLNLRNVVTIVACLAVKKVAIMHKKPIMLIGLVFCVFVLSCSSPESDGIKAAKMAYNYGKDYGKRSEEIVKEQNKAYESYIKKFDSYSFKTRVDAREKLNEYLEKPTESLQKLQVDAQEWEKKAYE